jgi:hypothetical protein
VIGEELLESRGKDSFGLLLLLSLQFVIQQREESLREPRCESLLSLVQEGALTPTAVKGSGEVSLGRRDVTRGRNGTSREG